MEQFQEKTVLKHKTEYLKESDFESFYIENLIMRTGSLLALCFGQAGSEIIASNMNTSKLSFCSGFNNNTDDYYLKC